MLLLASVVFFFISTNNVCSLVFLGICFGSASRVPLFTPQALTCPSPTRTATIGLWSWRLNGTTYFDSADAVVAVIALTWIDQQSLLVLESSQNCLLCFLARVIMFSPSWTEIFDDKSIETKRCRNGNRDREEYCALRSKILCAGDRRK